MKRRGIAAVAIAASVLAAATAWGLSISVVASGPSATGPTDGGDTGYATDVGWAKPAVSAKWGSAPGEIGLVLEGEPRGAAGFGVDDRERVYVLDPVNSRVNRYKGGVCETSFPLPDDDFEDIAVERDRICVLSRGANRRVLVFSDAGERIATLRVSDLVPPIFRVHIAGRTVLAECPHETGREYHALGTLDGLPLSAAAQALPYADAMPVAGGGTISAAILTENDISLRAVSDAKVTTSALRLHTKRDVVAILDATADREGSVYVAYVVVSEATSESPVGGSRLLVSRYARTGELTGRIETSHDAFPESLRRVIVSESGTIYTLGSDSDGVSVLRWSPQL